MAKYQINVEKIEERTSLDGDWLTADYVALLEKIGVDGGAQMSPAEAAEMCILGLQDLEPAETATALLQYKLGDLLTAGKIQNYSAECQSERLWEQSAEMELHRKMFGVASLLSQVDDTTFPTPKALCVSLAIKCDKSAAKVFVDPIPRSRIARLLAAGMDNRAVINRLFDDAVAGGKFPEADHIIWDVETTAADSGVTLKVTSSEYWLAGLRETESFEWDGPLRDE